MIGSIHITFRINLLISYTACSFFTVPNGPNIIPAFATVFTILILVPSFIWLTSIGENFFTVDTCLLHAVNKPYASALIRVEHIIYGHCWVCVFMAGLDLVSAQRHDRPHRDGSFWHRYRVDRWEDFIHFGFGIVQIDPPRSSRFHIGSVTYHIIVSSCHWVNI